MKVALLAGGVGGAKLADGFQRVLRPGELSVIVNVADDMTHIGLHVSPDLDTVVYTLAGLANPETGWGLVGDTAKALEMLGRYGEPTWFRLGDADLATHLHRTRLLAEGCSLTEVTARMTDALGLPSAILPVTDDELRTVVQTDAGELEFQDYFVRRRQRDEVRGITLRGIERARPTAAVLAALRSAGLVVVAPSNPIVSIGPLLALSGMREAVRDAQVPVVAVSPIVAGRALRGPADRMLASLGHEPTALGVARLYRDLVDRFVVDEADARLAPQIEALGMAVDVLPAIMHRPSDRAALAEAILRRVTP